MEAAAAASYVARILTKAGTYESRRRLNCHEDPVLRGPRTLAPGSALLLFPAARNSIIIIVAIIVILIIGPSRSALVSYFRSIGGG